MTWLSRMIRGMVFGSTIVGLPKRGSIKSRRQQLISARPWQISRTATMKESTRQDSIGVYATEGRANQRNLQKISKLLSTRRKIAHLPLTIWGYHCLKMVNLKNLSTSTVRLSGWSLPLSITIIVVLHSIIQIDLMKQWTISLQPYKRIRTIQQFISTVAMYF